MRDHEKSAGRAEECRLGRAGALGSEDFARSRALPRDHAALLRPALYCSQFGRRAQESVFRPFTLLTSQTKAMRDRLAARDALLQQAQTMTLQIRTDRTVLEASLTAESATVDAVVAKLPADQQAAAIKSAGMEVAESTGTPVGPMPKVEGLTATAGDGEGEINLAWNAIRRGLQNFLIELSEDPAGQTGWRFAANSRKSTATLDGLTTGKRCWFRVTAEGAAGPGPASTPATKVAP